MNESRDRDIPVKAVKLMKGLTAYCPVCSGWVGYEYRYCPTCGQKIWRKKYDEKEENDEKSSEPGCSL